MILKVLVLTKRVWISAVSIASAAVAALSAACFLIAATAERQLPVYCVENDRRQLALTFDAAWDDSGVDELIALLDRYKAKATVFAVGEWAEKYPQAVKKLSAAGHQIGNHSNKHSHVKNMSREQFVADTRACSERLERLTGKKVTVYRGPYGEYNDLTVTAARGLGLQSLQWDCDSLDWKPGYSAERVVGCALKNVKPGSVILMHIGAKPMLEALPVILERLTGEGYSFVTADELLIRENYYIDRAGKQRHKSAQSAG